MYLGMMRRGTELMAIFFASIFIVTVALGLSEIGVPLFIITFFYSLFDAQHINKAIRRGEIVQDQNIFFKKDYGLNGYHYGLIAIVLGLDRKSTRLNSSHVRISYAVFCLKK